MRLEYLLSGVVQTTRCAKNDNDIYLLKENPEDEAISGSAGMLQGQIGFRLVEQFSSSDLILRICTDNQIQSRSSAWLEHYTDNVGVSSSNLDGTTIGV